jgi:hypothetical protein
MPKGGNVKTLTMSWRIVDEARVRAAYAKLMSLQWDGAEFDSVEKMAEELVTFMDVWGKNFGEVDWLDLGMQRTYV